MDAAPATDDTAAVVRSGTDLLPLVKQLEGSGTDAVSNKGAIGLHQIMPIAARDVGADVSRLTDPEYNKQVAGMILNKLYQRFNGDTAAVLVGYNAGPSVAAKWLASGKQDPLPDETGAYLHHAVQLAQGGGLPKNPDDIKTDSNQTIGPPAPITAPPVPQGKQDYDRLLNELHQDPAAVESWKAQKSHEMLTEQGKTPSEIAAYFGDTPPGQGPVDKYFASNLSKVPDDSKPDVARDPMEIIKAGWGMSNMGQAYGQGNPVPKFTLPADASIGQRVLGAGAEMAGNAPTMMAGMEAGGAAGVALGAMTGPLAPFAVPALGLVGAGAGAFASPVAVRELMSDYYRRGEIHSFSDFMQMAGQSIKNVSHAALLGAAASPAGLVGRPVASIIGGTTGKVVGAVAADQAAAATTTTLQAAMDHKMPDAGDFLVNAALALPFAVGHVIGADGQPTPSKAAQDVADNLHTIWQRTGVNPWDLAHAAQSDPAVMQEILGVDEHGQPVAPKIGANAPDEPEAYGKTEPTTLGGKELAESEEAGLGQAKGEPLVANPPAGPEKIETDRGSGALGEEGLNEKAAEFIGEAPKEKYDLSVNSLLYRYVSELTPFRAIDDALVKAGKLDRKTQMGVEDMMRQTYTSNSTASYLIRKGGIDAITRERNGVPSLKDAFDLVEQDGKGKNSPSNNRDWVNYMVAKRANEKEDLGFSTGHPLDRGQRDELIRMGDSRYARATDSWNKTMDGVLQYGRDSGLFNDDQVGNMRRDNTMYISFRRLSGDDTVLPRPGIGRDFRVRSPVKEFEGDDRLIKDPLMASIDNIHRIIAMADRNRAIGSVIHLAETLREGPDDGAATFTDSGQTFSKTFGDTIVSGPKIFEREGQTFTSATGKGDAQIAEPGSSVFKPYQVEDTKTYEPFLAERMNRTEYRDGNKFTYIRDGKAETWNAIDPSLAEAMRAGEPTGVLDPLSAIMQGFAKVYRAGVAAPVDFALNVLGVKHPLTAFVYDPYHPAPIQFFKGIFGVLTKSLMFDEYVRNGGFGASMVELDRNYIREDLQNVLNKTGMFDKGWNVIKDPLQALQIYQTMLSKVQAAHGTMDAANRFGFYKTLRAQGVDAFKAATLSRGTYLDLSEQAGSAAVRTYARAVPFFRMSTLGTKYVFQKVGENPLASAGYLTAAIVMPTILSNLANYWADKTLPPDQQFKEVSRLDKDSHLVLPPVNGIRLKVPYGYTLSPIVGGMITRVMDHWLQNDPEAFDHFAQTIAAGLIPSVTPPMFIPPMEKITNYNFSSGHALMPDNLLHVVPDAQWVDSTTEIAKGLASGMSKIPGADAAGLSSPMWVEQYTKDILGPAGMSVMRAINLPYKTTSTPWQFADSPFMGSFFARNPQFNSESIRTFHDELEKMETANNTARLDIKRQFQGKVSDDVVEQRLAAAYPNLPMYQATYKALLYDWSDVANMAYISDKGVGAYTAQHAASAVGQQYVPDEKLDPDPKNATAIRRQFIDAKLNNMIVAARTMTAQMQADQKAKANGQ